MNNKYHVSNREHYCVSALLAIIISLICCVQRSSSGTQTDIIGSLNFVCTIALQHNNKNNEKNGNNGSFRATKPIISIGNVIVVIARKMLEIKSWKNFDSIRFDANVLWKNVGNWYNGYRKQKRLKIDETKFQAITSVIVMSKLHYRA